MDRTIDGPGAIAELSHRQLAHRYLGGRYKREGIPLRVWVANEEYEMRKLVHRGINGIFTTCPDVLDTGIQEEIGEG